MFCCTLLYVHCIFAIILIVKKELVALLGLSSWCLAIAAWLFLAVPWVCLWFVCVVFPDHTYFLFYTCIEKHKQIFLSGTKRPRAIIFGMLHYIVDLYQVCSHYGPGLKLALPGGHMFYIGLNIGRINMKTCSSLESQGIES